MRTFDLDTLWPSLPMLSANSGAARDSAGMAVETLSVSAPLGVPDRVADGARTFSTGDVALDVSPTVYEDTIPQRIASAAARRGSWAIRFVRSFDPKAAIWLSMGFASGMVAWHAVGFWGFVSASVFNGPGTATVIAETPSARPLVNFKSIITTSSTASAPMTTGTMNTAPMNTGLMTTGSLATFSAQPKLCVALAIDRATGATAAKPCGADDQPMRDAGRRRRADRMAGIEARLQNAGSWATDTQTEAPSASAASAQTNAVSDGDFDLTLASE